MSELATHTQALLTKCSKGGTFSLPGRKALLKSDVEYEVILVDATETPIERSQKMKEILLWQEKATYIKNSTVDKS